MNKEDILRRMPDGTKSLLSQGFHILSPTASWEHYKKREKAREQTAEFFGEETWERLESEFFEESGIVDIVMSAVKEEEKEVVFDTHQGVCSRLYAIIRDRNPKTVVATGVYSGVATTSMLLALEENRRGTLYSIDTSKKLSNDDDPSGRDSIADFYERGRPSCSERRSHELPLGRDPGWIVPEPIRDRWEFRSGLSREALPTLLEDLPATDLFYHDSDLSTSGMLFEFELAWNWLRRDGILISPHIDRNDAFEIFVEEHNCKHGVLHFDYHYSDEYDEPCSCGYIIKPSDPEAETSG